MVLVVAFTVMHNFPVSLFHGWRPRRGLTMLVILTAVVEGVLEDETSQFVTSVVGFRARESVRSCWSLRARCSSRVHSCQVTDSFLGKICRLMILCCRLFRRSCWEETWRMRRGGLCVTWEMRIPAKNSK